MTQGFVARSIAAVAVLSTTGCVAFFPSLMERGIGEPDATQLTYWDSSLAYTKTVRRDIEAEQTQLATTRESFKYGGLLTGFGTTLAAAAKASSDIILGFGAATGAVSAVNFASGSDDKAKILTRGQQAIACLQYAAETLHAPLPTPANPPKGKGQSLMDLEMTGASAYLDSSKVLNALLEGSLSRQAGPPAELQVNALSAPSPQAKEGFSILAQVQAAQVANSTEQLRQKYASLLAQKAKTDEELPKLLSTNSWKIYDTVQKQLIDSGPSLDVVIGKAKDIVSEKSDDTKKAANDASQAAKNTKAQITATQTTSARLAERLDPKNADRAEIMRTEAFASQAAAADVVEKVADELQRLVDQAQKCDALTNPPKDGGAKGDGGESG